MKHNIVIIISFLFLLSCTKKNEDCATIQPPEPDIYIKIEDSFGISLIGEDNIYKPSEITLTRENQTVPLMFLEENEETLIKIYYPEIESGEDYQLKLNDQETDILNLKLVNTEGFCYDVLSVEVLKVNDVELMNEGGFAYVIIK